MNEFLKARNKSISIFLYEASFSGEASSRSKRGLQILYKINFAFLKSKFASFSGEASVLSKVKMAKSVEFSETLKAHIYNFCDLSLIHI